MEKFNIKLANIVIGVNALFSSTKNFCRDYLTDEKEAFDVFVDKEDIVKERQINQKQMDLDGMKQSDYSDEYIETLALYRKITSVLLKYNVLLFHGCAIAKDGKVYLFTAKSGVGKTTHARLWIENIPDCHVVNGDKPLLLFKNDKAFVCGTPWMGKEKIGVNEIVPLKAICMIERDSTNHIERVSFSDAFPFIFSQTHCPEGDNSMLSAVKLLSELNNIGIYKLGCNMDKEAAYVAYNTMVLEGDKE